MPVHDDPGRRTATVPGPDAPDDRSASGRPDGVTSVLSGLGGTLRRLGARFGIRDVPLTDGAGEAAYVLLVDRIPLVIATVGTTDGPPPADALVRVLGLTADEPPGAPCHETVRLQPCPAALAPVLELAPGRPTAHLTGRYRVGAVAVELRAVLRVDHHLCALLPSLATTA